MPNILIIVKMNKFKEQPSDNRFHFLNFLSLKKNIKILNDNPKTTLKKWLVSTKKRFEFSKNAICFIGLFSFIFKASFESGDFMRTLLSTLKSLHTFLLKFVMQTSFDYSDDINKKLNK